MEKTVKELRKMLNRAWDARDDRLIGWFTPNKKRQDIRYRDVSKIIKEAEEAKRGEQ